MSPAGRVALPRVITSVQTFADVTITAADEPSTIVQVISRYWVYEDESWMVAVHNADNPALNHVEQGTDAEGAKALRDRAEWLRKLAAVVVSALPLALMC